jgi:hypothetical protein
MVCVSATMESTFSTSFGGVLFYETKYKANTKNKYYVFQLIFEKFMLQNENEKWMTHTFVKQIGNEAI